MRKAVAFLVGIAGVWLLGTPDIHACGDKFLVVGRGVRYSRAHATPRPASILIYMNPTSKLPAAAKESQLEASLKQAGHRVQTVGDASGLQGALKSAKYDLVLADIADSPALEKQVESEPSRAMVVPVLYKPTPEELAAAQKQYGCAMNAPSKDPLSAIDAAMSQKQRVTEGKTGKAK